MPVTPASSRPAYLSEIQRALDPERLDTYTHPAIRNHSLLDKIACYTWNVALCESLYPALHVGEILLRNSVFRAVESAYHVRPRRGTLCWLDAGRRVLTEEHAKRVVKAKGKLERELRSKGLTMTVGRLIAELGFGFWTYLFDKEYGYRSPGEPRLWPGLLDQVFPNLPKSVPRERDVIHRRLIRIRQLRNRAFHHEPVWKYGDLRQRYDESIDLIRWISPPIARTVETLDRFWHVHQQLAHRHMRHQLYLISGRP